VNPKIFRVMLFIRRSLDDEKMVLLALQPEIRLSRSNNVAKQTR
jgi:hypothetical protein